MISYGFANPGWMIHDTSEGDVHWSIWTLRGGLTGRCATWDAARAELAKARSQWPFADDKS